MRSLRDANAEQRRLRPELPVGIGGASRSGSLKCLHAHAAFALARPGYELGDRILAEVPSLWPDNACCIASLCGLCRSTPHAPTGSGDSPSSRRRRATSAGTGGCSTPSTP